MTSPNTEPQSTNPRGFGWVWSPGKDGAEPAIVRVPGVWELVDAEAELDGILPITIEVSASLIVEDPAFLADLLPAMRRELFLELGVRFPGIAVRAREDDLAPGVFTISIHGVPAVSAVIVGGRHDDLMEHLVHQLAGVLRARAADFVGIEEVAGMLARFAETSPALVGETVPKIVTLGALTGVLRALAKEGVSIRDLRAILEAIASWGRVEHDTERLTERVRETALSRQIFHQYAGGRRVIGALLLDPELEDELYGAVDRMGSELYLPVAQGTRARLIDALIGQIRALPPGSIAPVLLTSRELRPHLRRLIEVELPWLAVLSFHELPPEAHVQPLASVALAA